MKTAEQNAESNKMRDKIIDILESNPGMKALYPLLHFFESTLSNDSKEYTLETGDGYGTVIGMQVVEQEKESEPDSNLLPCPFCNTKPIWINEAVSDGHYYIKCPYCHIVMKEDRRDKVIGMWNNRAGTSELKSRIAELEKTK